MPASERSLRITDSYRVRLQRLRARAVLIAEGAWRTNLDPAALDRSHQAWVVATAAATAEMQRGGARLSAAYIAAYLTSETGRRVSPPAIDTNAHVGSRDGRPLAEALVPSLFTVKAAIAEGRPISEAMGMGLSRAARLVGEEAVNPSRLSLAEAIRGDDRIVGWRRVTSGGCGACIGAATGDIEPDGAVIETHPNCECTSEPVVADAPDRVERPTGPAIFNSLTPERQDAILGPDKAQLLRDGRIGFQDLVQRDPQAVIADGITEAPLQALQPQH